MIDKTVDEIEIQKNAELLEEILETIDKRVDYPSSSVFEIPLWIPEKFWKDKKYSIKIIERFFLDFPNIFNKELFFPNPKLIIHFINHIILQNI
jgi:hypothetical protein